MLPNPSKARLFPGARITTLTISDLVFALVFLFTSHAVPNLLRRFAIVCLLVRFLPAV